MIAEHCEQKPEGIFDTQLDELLSGFFARR